MQEQRISMSDEVLVPKLRKKKSSTRMASVFQAKGDNVERAQKQAQPYPTQATQKASKRGMSNVVPASLQLEKSPSDSLTEPSTSGNEYRALRIKYLLLEEESFELGKEVRETEDEIENLEKEKLDLLDELVVLEGLVDPSELRPRGLGSK